ncbi:unnamed protein product [marine sediment metagenome]|uniref:Carbohydrate-binding module family 96 domain-containing protein n=1 Tax=marine sediment metagenome TaxID=412755 RepID=X1NM24_9ZZZZ
MELEVLNNGNTQAYDDKTITITITYPTKSFQYGVYPTAGYTDMIDTEIEGGNKENNNYGDATTIEVDAEDATTLAPEWGLFEWDISSEIPVGSTVQSASITLYVDPGDPGGSFDFYELKKNWTETGATWNKYDGINDWQSPGAEGADDRGTTVLGTMPGTAGSHTVTLNSSGIALVQNWVNNPDTNYGVILRGSSTAGTRYFSSENSDTANRPKLTIEYIPAGWI